MYNCGGRGGGGHFTVNTSHFSFLWHLLLAALAYSPNELAISSPLLFLFFSVWCHLWSLHFLSPSQFDIYSLFLRHTLQVTCTEIKSENEPICVAETTAEAETWGADQLPLHFAPSQTGVYSFQKIINAVSKEVKMCFNSCTSTSILIRGYIK